MNLLNALLPKARISRRSFVVGALGAAAIAAPTIPWLGARPHAGASGVRLDIRPVKPTKSLGSGLHQLGLASGRDALLYVPNTDNTAVIPLFVALHGAAQAGELMTTRLAGLADTVGCAILAPDSRGMTWDAIRGDFDVDPAFIGRAIAWTFDRVAIDATRLWIGGFSDGASYALSVGIANGDVLSRVLGFSPGFVIPTARQGTPAFFVSHGRDDPILPIYQCSRVIVPELRRAGYRVRFEEFEGGHEMPPEVLIAAGTWLAH